MSDAALIKNRNSKFPKSQNRKIDKSTNRKIEIGNLQYFRRKRSSTIFSVVDCDPCRLQNDETPSLQFARAADDAISNECLYWLYISFSLAVLLNEEIDLEAT